jgi:hypothetical protein
MPASRVPGEDAMDCGAKLQGGLALVAYWAPLYQKEIRGSRRQDGGFVIYLLPLRNRFLTFSLACGLTNGKVVRQWVQVIRLFEPDRLQEGMGGKHFNGSGQIIPTQATDG